MGYPGPVTRLYVFALLVFIIGCGGAGPYGYARDYVPLGDEESHLESATGISYEEVRRDPVDFQSTKLGWFGVVTEVNVDSSGAGTITMTYRTLSARNLCEDERDSSCRVTVSERAGGPFTAQVQLRQSELDGQKKLWVGSLVKVYGSPTGELDSESGGPIIAADFHRHWPRGTYVTTGARRSMRR